MSELNRPMRVARSRRWTFPSSAVLAAAVTVAALLSAGADARATATPSNTAPPAVTGTAVVNETLTAVSGSWTGTPPITFALAWQRCDSGGGGGCTSIPGETGQTHVVTADDIGSTLRVLETATNAEGSASAESAPTAVVTGISAPVSTGDPVVSGASFEGSTLSTTTGTWSGTSLAYAYQWVRCGSDGGLPDGSNCPSIPGATGSSYTLVAADIGHRLRVQVTASNPAGSATAASNPSALVEQSTTTGPPRSVVEPSISGTLVLGRIVLASIGTWAGETPISYAYQWMRCGADGGLSDASNCAAISGADTSTYTLAADDVGARLRIRIAASNSLGAQTVASNATATVQSSSTTTPSQAPANTRAPLIFGQPVRDEQLTSSVGLWTGTTPLVFSYRWLRCPASGGQVSGSDCTAITGATGTQYELTADDVGRRIRLQVTARNTLGSATATSDATALVTATATTPPPPPTTLPPGAIRLADGKYSIPVTSVSEPQRLVAQQIVFTPNPVRSRQRPLELRIRVLDTRGYVVRDALVFARSTPLLTSAPGEQRTARDGWVRLRMTLHADFPLGGGRSVQFFVRVRKPSDDLLAGVSSRRLVQVATAG